MYGWRAWNLARDDDGPFLVSPLVLYMSGPTDRVFTAECPTGHEPPQPGCKCGIYLMPTRHLLAMYCFPADVVTRVRAVGRTADDPVGWMPYPGEVRATTIRIRGSASISPAYAQYAPQLQARYGVEFQADPSLDMHPGLTAVQMRLQQLQGQLNIERLLNPPAAGLVLTNQTRTHVVLQMRSRFVDNPLAWAFPGGAQLPGESPTQAAFREAREEHQTLTPLLPDHADDTLSLNPHYTYVLATAPQPDPLPTEIPASSSEAVAAGWVPIAAVHNHNLHPQLRQDWPALRRLLTKQEAAC